MCGEVGVTQAQLAMPDDSLVHLMQAGAIFCVVVADGVAAFALPRPQASSLLHRHFDQHADVSAVFPATALSSECSELIILSLLFAQVTLTSSDFQSFSYNWRAAPSLFVTGGLSSSSFGGPSFAQ